MSETFYLISADGTKRRVSWDDTPLPGETIEVKQNWVPFFRDIVSPVATVATVIISIINISK